MTFCGAPPPWPKDHARCDACGRAVPPVAVIKGCAMHEDPGLPPYGAPMVLPGNVTVGVSCCRACAPGRFRTPAQPDVPAPFHPPHGLVLATPQPVTWMWVLCGADGAHMFARGPWLRGATHDAARCGRTPLGYAHGRALNSEGQKDGVYRRIACAACWEMYTADRATETAAEE